MDSDFSFLSDYDGELLKAVLKRRDPTLADRLKADGRVSRPDAKLIMNVLSEEFIDNLDDEWEPTPYGKEISDVLNRFNAARLGLWG